MFRKPSPRLLIPAALMFASLSVGLVMPGHTLAHAADGHPARIHEGSCEATGAAAEQLTGVGATVSLEGTPIAEPEMTGAERRHIHGRQRNHPYRIARTPDQ